MSVLKAGDWVTVVGGPHHDQQGQVLHLSGVDVMVQFTELEVTNEWWFGVHQLKLVPEHSGCPHECEVCDELMDSYLGLRPKAERERLLRDSACQRVEEVLRKWNLLPAEFGPATLKMLCGALVDTVKS
jgi:hypothetical protein